jgi:hypothetical protein
MVTKKKMEKMLRSIWFHHTRLQRALSEAHHYGLIAYSDWNLGPCHAMDELRIRIENTTQKQIANIIQSDIRANIQ